MKTSEQKKNVSDTDVAAKNVKNSDQPANKQKEENPAKTNTGNKNAGPKGENL